MENILLVQMILYGCVADVFVVMQVMAGKYFPSQEVVRVVLPFVVIVTWQRVKLFDTSW